MAMRPGSWTLESKTDPRWNCSGNSPSVGMFALPQEAKDKLDELTKQFGEPPEDLEWGYTKN
jgi:hypothetical protein